MSPGAVEKPAASEPLKTKEGRKKRKHDSTAIETTAVDESSGQPSPKKTKPHKDSNPNSAHSCVGDNAPKVFSIKPFKLYLSMSCEMHFS